MKAYLRERGGGRKEEKRRGKEEEGDIYHYWWRWLVGFGPSVISIVLCNFLGLSTPSSSEEITLRTGITETRLC